MKKTTLILAAVAAAASLLAAEDIAGIRAQLQAKYAKFDKLVRDLKMDMDVSTAVSEEKGKKGARDGGESMTSVNTMYYKEPKFRMDSKMSMGKGEMTTTVIFDGTDMWLISMMGSHKLAAKDQAKYAKDRSWKWWTYLTEGGSVTGSEEVGGRDCWVIEFAQPKEKDAARPPFSKLWLDKEKLVQVKAEFPIDKGKTGMALYSDVRPAIGKMELPHKTEMYADGKLAMTSVIRSIEYNKGVADDLFDAKKAKGQGQGFGDLLKGMGGQ